ncbi:hypothetical protein BIV57_06050 [Mangrovactinospora gilvigrisea]|uniref:HTH lysR-type domain-containing protein n=1 Tax=Mangrovactinospora gilvigrisea TaxID=1428644 RepID=A0A1J7BY27_9ACTN|nr:hypothetical protein BIV57_06050 [Mangrovactinospora gilvigrisea]
MEAFLTLAEELHFGRTAERLGLSPGRVTQIIQRLERRAGVALFDRTSRRVELTEVGRELRDEVEPAHRRIELAWARAVDAGRGVSGALRLAYLGAPQAEVLVRVMDEFHRRHPRSEAVLACESQVDDHLAPLRDGRADLLATRFPVQEPDLVQGPVLTREPMVLAVRSGHRLAGLEVVELEELADEPVVLPVESAAGYWLDALVPAMTPSGRPIPRLRLAPTFPTLLALVGAGRGVCPLPLQAVRFYPRPDVQYVPMRGIDPDEWGLVWRASDAAAPRVRAFAEAAEAELRKAGGPDGMAAWLTGN